MYQVIIADDEEAVRSGLRKHFDWTRYDMRVVADFPDGERAWQYILSHPVDLVVTDVRMPNLDGIALARQIRETYPRTQVIFISGYDDTQYLRRAFKTDAVDYILKSIDLEEFAQTIAHVRERMDRETSRQRAMEELEAKLDESIPLLQQRGLMLLISNELKYGEISRERLRFLNIPLYDAVHYCVLVVQIRDLWRRFTGMTERQRQLFSLRFVNSAKAMLATHGSEVAFENHLGEYVVMLNTEQEDYESDLLKVIQALQQIVENDLEAKCTIGVSDRFIGLEGMHTAYESAVNAIASRYYLNESHSVSVDKFGGVNLHSARERAEKSVSEALLSGRIERVNEVMEAVFADMDAMGSPQERQNFLLYLLLLPPRVMSNMHSREMGPYADQVKLMEQFLCCGDLRERRLFLLRQYEAVLQLLNQRSETQSNYIVERTRQLIETYYMNQISIASLAEQVFVTPTYLCVLFKQATGQTVNEYITQVRMQRAKALLADSRIKLYDVCTQVGYLSPSYFSRIFKKFTLMTPSEYREAHINRE